MVLKKNWVLILIVFIAFSGSLANYISRVPQRHYCDFRVYYKAGQDLIKGKNIYIRDRDDVTPYKYSPFFALVFVPLSLFPIKISAAVFFSINFVLTILFFKLSFNLLQNSGIGTPVSQRDRSLIYGLTLLFTFRYICLVWYSGQVNILMCVLVLLALRSLSKDKTAFSGAFFASSILIKYTPAIFLPYLLVRKHIAGGLLKIIRSSDVKSVEKDLYITVKTDSVSANLFAELQRKIEAELTGVRAPES